MLKRNSFCKLCKKTVGRLDNHLRSAHPTYDTPRYLKKFYLTKEHKKDAFDCTEQKVTCLACNKKVTWFETHIENKHSLLMTDYLSQYLLDYDSIREDFKKDIAKHYLLDPWDSYLIYRNKIEKMVRSISYKKQLDRETAEDLSSQAIELFLRFHDEYDPDFVSPDPKYAQKTDDYYEKYMFSKVRAQLGYFVQKHYIHSNREWAGLGLSTELEPYSPIQEDEFYVDEGDMWDRVRKHLSKRQIVVFDLLLSGLPQREISEKANLTQSWVSSIKSHIKIVIKTLMEQDKEFCSKITEYYLST